MARRLKTVLWRWSSMFMLGFFARWYTLQRRWWKLKFRLESAGSMRQLKYGDSLRFNVPLRIGAGEGTLKIGDGVGFGYFAAPMQGDGTILLEPRSKQSVISIGDGTKFSNNVSIVSMEKINIGKHCLIGDQTIIYDCDFHATDPGKRMSAGSAEAVFIGNNVWLGSRVIILRGVVVGDNSVIGTGSVVTRSVPANCIAAGVPARVIRML